MFLIVRNISKLRNSDIQNSFQIKILHMVSCEGSMLVSWPETDSTRNMGLLGQFFKTTRFLEIPFANSQQHK